MRKKLHKKRSDGDSLLCNQCFFKKDVWGFVLGNCAFVLDNRFVVHV